MKKTVLLLLSYFCSVTLFAQKDSTHTYADSLKIARLENDALTYNARYFKTNPDATLSDLLRKLPAVQYQENTWLARGEKLTDYSVNYYTPFYRNQDALLHNMPARFVDKVTFYEEATTAGFYQRFNDNEYDRAVNFQADSNYYKYTDHPQPFGRAFLGGGMPDGKWNAGLNMNYMQGSRIINVTAGSNNVNDNNFTNADITGVQGSSGIEEHGAGNSAHDAASDFIKNLSLFKLDQSIGINTTNDIGFSYFDWPGNVLFYVNYFYNTTNNNTESTLERDYVSQSEENTFYNESSNANSVNRNHRLRLRGAYYFDPFTILRLTAALSTQQTNGSNEVISAFSNNFSPNLQSYDSSIVDRTGIDSWVELAFIKKSEKRPNRSFTATITPSVNRQDGNSGLIADIYDDKHNYDLSFKSNYFRNDANISARFAYTEPLGEHSKLIVDYTPEIDWGHSYKKTSDFKVNNPEYQALDSLMSNDFLSTYMKQRLGVGSRYNQGKWDITASLYAQYATVKNTDTRHQPLDFKNHLFSIFPMLNMIYKASDRQQLRLHFKGFTKKPTLAQMENVERMNNPFNLTAGNPRLEMEWHNYFDARYTIISKDHSASWLFFASAEYINNYIGSRLSYIPISLNAPGKITLTRPQNFDHLFGTTLYATYSKYLPAWKVNVDAGLQYAYAYIPGMIDDSDNTLKRNTTALNLRLSSGISEAIDFILSSNTAYNFIRYTSNDKKADVFQQNTYAAINVIFGGGWFANTNVTQTYNYYTSSSSGQNVFLWNASAGYKFLPRQAAEIRLTAHDLLDKNQNIDYYITGSYTENSSSNNIKRYFMLSLAYNL